jgi:hypothetical protein
MILTKAVWSMWKEFGSLQNLSTINAMKIGLVLKPIVCSKQSACLCHLHQTSVKDATEI